jgi:ComF family protein
MGDAEEVQGEILVCTECKALLPAFKTGISCWLYDGVGRDIILALKYRQADFLKNDIASLLQDHCAKVIEFTENSIVVPVPTHYFRRLGRGYNQAEVIARAVAKISPGTTVISILKSKHKKSQTKLKKAERLLNIKNMFECAPASDSVAKNSRIVLVDDVITTGATLRECCTILQRAGFNNLHVLTLAYG